MPFARCHIHNGGPPRHLGAFRLVGLGLAAMGKQAAVRVLTPEGEGSHPTGFPEPRGHHRRGERGRARRRANLSPDVGSALVLMTSGKFFNLSGFLICQDLR